MNAYLVTDSEVEIYCDASYVGNLFTTSGIASGLDSTIEITVDDGFPDDAHYDQFDIEYPYGSTVEYNFLSYHNGNPVTATGYSSELLSVNDIKIRFYDCSE